MKKCINGWSFGFPYLSFFEPLLSHLLELFLLLEEINFQFSNNSYKKNKLAKLSWYNCHLTLVKTDDILGGVLCQISWFFHSWDFFRKPSLCGTQAVWLSMMNVHILISWYISIVQMCIISWCMHLWCICKKWRWTDKIKEQLIV